MILFWVVMRFSNNVKNLAIFLCSSALGIFMLMRITSFLERLNLVLPCAKTNNFLRIIDERR